MLVPEVILPEYNMYAVAVCLILGVLVVLVIIGTVATAHADKKRYYFGAVEQVCSKVIIDGPELHHMFIAGPERSQGSRQHFYVQA